VKQLALMRHAQAEAKQPSMSDFERPLTRRGLNEASIMARRSVELAQLPDVLLVSPALRARQTAAAFMRAAGLPQHRLLEDERLYLADAPALLQSLRSMAAGVDRLLVVGHNPGLTELARQCDMATEFHEIETGAICLLTLDIGAWAECSLCAAVALAYDSPRRHFETPG
jgi:phosphohistidine phosphatase